MLSRRLSALATFLGLLEATEADGKRIEALSLAARQAKGCLELATVFENVAMLPAKHRMRMQPVNDNRIPHAHA